MRRLLAFAPYMLVAPGIQVIFLALIACAASLALQGQTEARTSGQDQSTPSIVPVNPVPAAAASVDVSDLGKPTTRFGGAASDFGKSQFQPLALPKAAGDNSPQWNRSMLDPFQPGPNFGKFKGSAGIFNRFGGTEMRERQDNFESVFQTRASGRHSMSSSENSNSSSSPLTLPSFNTLMRTNRGQPSSPSLGAFKLSNRELLGPRGNAFDPGLFPGSTLFSSSDLGNGIVFSAGTGSGSRSAAGAPAASLGTGTAGGQKHSSPLVNLKLSF